jgi:hypothetical protein
VRQAPSRPSGAFRTLKAVGGAPALEGPTPRVLRPSLRHQVTLQEGPGRAVRRRSRHRAGARLFSRETTVGCSPRIPCGWPLT